VLDEVQTGLGRTGAMWAYQHEGVSPDMVITGKGLSGGIYPITATLMRREIHAFFDDHPFVHVSTFGGSEVGCVAALAVLDIVEQPGFLERVRALGDRFEAGLVGVDVELRRRGLFMGLKLAGAGDGLMASAGLIRAGVFAVYANNDTSVVQLLPPLILDDEEADEIIAIIRTVLA
jgi:acetylornithine/succinyldiaminopimelate/putrescine aminotransferase